MPRTKITQNINKDAGLMDLPKVVVPHSQWETKHSNYISCDIGKIVPIYVDEVLPSEKRKVTMGMLSHMTTPIAPIFNAQYTEFRAFFVPHRLSADLLAGYKTRKSPWVKVFGEDNASASSSTVVSLANQKLPDVSDGFDIDYLQIHYKAFGGLFDSLDVANNPASDYSAVDFNWLNVAAYELIYQKAYRNENRESATESLLYRFLFDAYNRSSGIVFDDDFHTASREKDYFTGAQPFTQKGDPISVPIAGEAPIMALPVTHDFGNGQVLKLKQQPTGGFTDVVKVDAVNLTLGAEGRPIVGTNLVADMHSISGVSIEQLRVYLKTQELLEKDMMYGTKYSESLNAHFGTSPISLILDEPLELKKVTITSQMQAIFQTSTTANEQTILGTIGANATTNSGEFEIVPLTEFKEHGYLIICAVHKAQNSYDSILYRPKHIYKKARFDFYTPELNDLGYQPVSRKEFNLPHFDASPDETVGFNEAFAEYRFKFNKVHGMFEPNRNNALDYWTLAIASYDDIQSLYKQSKTELDRAISVTSVNAPQFYDAYGFIEYNDKPMSLHSIPGMDGVI